MVREPWLYEAVFISKLTCQLSSFFVQNFVQTTSTLYKERRQPCTNNVHTLYEQRQLCTNNVNIVRTTTTLYEQRQLCTNNVNFVRTSTLHEQRQLCTNNDNCVRTTSTLHEQRQLCTNNDNFVRTTTTLYEQRQLCTNNVHTCPNSAEKLSIDLSSLRKLSAIPIWRTIPVTELPVVKLCSLLIIKISTFYLPGILKIMCTG